ncbi:MAG: ABC transporter ATP-binding protein [Verrucomicrobia bacterium]|nr:ABC transporter ATP-binding protein [Verrucomicrobiota bacterium]
MSKEKAALAESIDSRRAQPGLAIDVAAVGKSYRSDRGLHQWLARGIGLGGSGGANGTQGGVTALAEVSFSVARGEAFGVIGRNGAGKSTLLQIIAGTLRASTGECRVHGRVTALLELGSGFNPEFTGRENVYLAGAILGISRSEMDRRFDDIARFADIGAFIEQPVKTYSTGMLMRVAFGVAISVEPDVLIIDEALSVGDILFQQKCSRRLHELIQAGVTLLVVTHDLAFVLNMCQRAMWLDQGRVRFLGPAGECVREYVAAMTAISGNAPAPSDEFAALTAMVLPRARELDLGAKERLGDGGVRVGRAWLLHADGTASSAFRVGDWAIAVLLVQATKEARCVGAGCELRNRHGQVVFATGLRVARRLVDRIPAGESCLVTIRFRLELQPGQYTLDLGCGAGSDADTTWDRVLNAVVVDVSTTPEQEVVHGLVRLPYEIQVARPQAGGVR